MCQKIRDVTQSSAPRKPPDKTSTPGSDTGRAHRGKEWLERVVKGPCALLPSPWKGSFPDPGEFYSRKFNFSQAFNLRLDFRPSNTAYKELC